MNIDFNKHIWEGWCVKDFIEAIEDDVDRLISNSEEFHIPVTKKDIKDWCINSQPYIKKYIPEVVTYFINKYNIK